MSLLGLLLDSSSILSGTERALFAEGSTCFIDGLSPREAGSTGLYGKPG